MACMLAHLCPTFCNPTDCSLPEPGKNTEVGCHFLLQGFFLSQGSNPCPLHHLHCRQILYCWAWEAPGPPSQGCKMQWRAGLFPSEHVQSSWIDGACKGKHRLTKQVWRSRSMKQAVGAVEDEERCNPLKFFSCVLLQMPRHDLQPLVLAGKGRWLPGDCVAGSQFLEHLLYTQH